MDLRRPCRLAGGYSLPEEAYRLHDVDVGNDLEDRDRQKSVVLEYVGFSSFSNAAHVLFTAICLVGCVALLCGRFTREGQVLQ